MVGKTSVRSLRLLVQDQVDQIKSGQKRRWELNVLDHGKLRLIFGVDGIGGGKNGCTGVKRADDTSLGYRDGLLLHGLMENDTRIVVHLVKLIDTANSTVRQDQGTGLEDKLLRLRIPSDVNSETDGGTSLS